MDVLQGSHNAHVEHMVNFHVEGSFHPQGSAIYAVCIVRKETAVFVYNVYRNVNDKIECSERNVLCVGLVCHL